MKDFFASKIGNTILGIIFTLINFAVINSLFELSPFIGGAIAGGLGFGAASAFGRNTKKDEPQEIGTEENTVVNEEVISEDADENLDETEETNNEENI